ncbi:hypothetical protein B0H14DRAFT_3491819 [Mycena olivaceomarginata]|nr:hypothetical protein B0H14DRAFT_3491819 [Mycena olivaceomarginata]
MPPPGRSHCCPPFIPEPGHEDVLAFCSKAGRLYVVTNGTRNGVYTSEARARKTVDNVSNGRWRMAKTWEKALNVWNEACDAYHEERCPSHLEEPILSHTGPLFLAPTGSLGVRTHNAKVVFNTGNSDHRFRTTKISDAEALQLLPASSIGAMTPAPSSYRATTGPAFAPPSPSSASRSGTAHLTPTRPKRAPVATAPPSPLATTGPTFAPPSSSSVSRSGTAHLTPTRLKRAPVATAPPSPLATAGPTFAHPSSSSASRSGTAHLTPTRLKRAPMTTVPPSPLAMMDAVEVFSRMGVDDPSAETKRRNCTNAVLMEALQMLKFNYKKARLNFISEWQSPAVPDVKVEVARKCIRSTGT